VPVPRPVNPAVLAIPTPLASWTQARSILSGSAPGRPRRLRTTPALDVNLPSRTIVAFDGLQPCAYPLPDHAALELGKRACDLQAELAHGACRCRCSVGRGRGRQASRCSMVPSRSTNERAKPIDGPGHDNVERAPVTGSNPDLGCESIGGEACSASRASFASGRMHPFGRARAAAG